MHTQEIHGEVYEVDSKMLQCIDELEEHPDHYTRTPVDVLLQPADGGDVIPLSCDIYFLYDFKEELLALPHISDYDGKSPEQLLYIPHTERKDPGVSAKSQVKKC